ncbi:hypothetical protein BG004_002628 [Podila humilis]|nr:hypothetical protein BG004_002628 [Podila humilis]
MAEASFVVLLIMSKIFENERSKGLFKAVLARQHVQMGPLAHKAKDGHIIVSDRPLTEITAPPSSSSLPKRTVMAMATDKSQEMAKRVSVWLVTMPLNFVPVLGPMIFCYINGMARVPGIHRRYFDMKNMTPNERIAWIQAREGLELVPLAGIVFGFTNTIGAALWAIDLEKEQDTLRKSEFEKRASSTHDT